MSSKLKIREWIDSLEKTLRDKSFKVGGALIIISFLTIFFTQLNQLGIVFLRQKLETRLTTFIDISMAVSSTFITVILIYCSGLGIISKLLGSLVSSFFLFLLYIFLFMTQIKFQTKFQMFFKLINKLLKFLLKLTTLLIF